MANRHVSRDQMKAFAELVGLKLDVERLEALRPGYERLLQGIDGLARLGLGCEEPATIFIPRRE